MDRTLRRRHQRAVWAGVAVFATLTTAVACGEQHVGTSARQHLQVGAISLPADEPSGWSVSYPISLPAGYGTPTGLATDTTNDDVWFFAQGPDQRLFHWSHELGKITDSYPIDNTDPATQAGQFTPIALDSAGKIWLGINQTLIVLTPGRDDLQQVALPPVQVGAAGSGLPHTSIPDFGAHTSIDAISSGPKGTLVASRMFATELQTVNTSSFEIGTIPLPGNTAVAGLGAGDLAGDGNRIAVALYASDREHQLGQLTDGAWSTTSPCDAYSVAIAGQYLATSGAGCVAGGPNTTGPTTVKPIPVPGLPEHSMIAIVRNAMIVSTVSDGLIAATATSQSPVISLGKVAAGPSIGGNSTDDPDRLIPIRPVLMDSAGDGNVYFVPANQSRIGLARYTS